MLAGSAQYPVKDAFNELGKRTLNTFLNAMTWPDRTVYPTSSAVKADYFNLASVYMDLVFNPLLEPETFKQEGHHLELEDLDDPSSALKISGVVYNEMKGANSSPERLHYREILAALMEDTPYAYDSGGDPAVMPELTYEQFKDFHHRFYSPSNARFFLYGDVSLEENLQFVAERLENFDRIDVDSSIPIQGRWTEPRRSERSYSIGSDEEATDKTFVTVSWLTNDTLDVMTSLLLEIAVDALYGSAGAPLRKALVDSGLGQAPYPGGAYGGSGQQTTCSFGLRGTNAEHAEAIETLILETLAKVIEDGLDTEKIEASFHQIEMSGKEISPPFPLQLLMRANPVWYFGGDPKDGLRFATLVEDARKAWEAEPGVFERLLKEWLIDNPHRHTLVMTPEPGLATREESALAETMAERKASLSQADIERILEEAKALKVRQNTPDSPENIARLPALSVEDIPQDPRRFDTVERDLGGTLLLEHPAFSNGVAYIGLAFDTRDLTDEESLYLPFVGRAIRGLGAAGLDYGDMATRIARYTGGISFGPTTGRHLETRERFERLCVDGSVLTRNAEIFFTILGELMFETDTSDHKRIRDMLQQSAAHKTASVVPSGHAYARTRAAASLDPVLWRSEQWGGITQLRFLKGASTDEGAPAEIAARIVALREKLFTRARVTLSLAGDSRGVGRDSTTLRALPRPAPGRRAGGGGGQCGAWRHARRGGRHHPLEGELRHLGVPRAEHAR